MEVVLQYKNCVFLAKLYATHMDTPKCVVRCIAINRFYN